MGREILKEDAERVVTVAMTRWKEVRAEESENQGEPIKLFMFDTRGRTLLDFAIDETEKRPLSEHNTPKPIDGLFRMKVGVTTALATDFIAYAEDQSRGLDVQHQFYDVEVKRFVAGNWLLILKGESPI